MPFNPLPPTTLSPPQVNRLALKRLKDMRTFLNVNEIKVFSTGDDNLDDMTRFGNSGAGHPAHYAMYKDDVVVKENLITFPEITNANELRAIIRSIYWLNNEHTIASVEGVADAADAEAKGDDNDTKEQISLAFDAMKSVGQLSAGELETRRGKREENIEVRRQGQSNAGENNNEIPSVDYHVGQVVKHKNKKWRGVVVGWIIEKDKANDNKLSSLTMKQYKLPSPLGEENDGDASPKETSGKVKYTVLVDINDAQSDKYSYEVDGDVPFLKSVTLESQADLAPVNDPCLQRIQNDMIKKYFTKFDAKGHFVPNDIVAYVYPLDQFSHCKYDTGVHCDEHVEKETVETESSAVLVESSRKAIISGVNEIGRRLLLQLTESQKGKDEEIGDDDVSMMIASLTSSVQSMLKEDVDSQKQLDSAISSLAKLYHFHVKINALLWTRNANKRHKEHINYSLGQVVKHKIYGFRGVIVAWDRVPRMDVSNWDGLQDVERPNEKPFYHVHPDVNDSITAFGGPRHWRYVCQDNLEESPQSMKPLELQVDFDPGEWMWDAERGSYVPSAETKFMYGEDLGKNETICVEIIRNMRKTLSDCVLEIRNGDSPELFTMDDLFRQLQSGAENLEDAIVVQDLVKEIWKESSNIDLRDQLDNGIAELVNGKHQNALDAFSAIVAYDPLYGEAWNKKATVHYMMGDREKSIESAEEALKIEPRNFQALAGIGLVEMDSSQYDKAIESFQKCLTIHPWLATVSSRLSKCMNRKDNGL